MNNLFETLAKRNSDGSQRGKPVAEIDPKTLDRLRALGMLIVYRRAPQWVFLSGKALNWAEALGMRDEHVE